MMEAITDEDVRDNLFRIISLDDPDKIKQLSQLSQVVNLAGLLAQVKALEEAEAYKRNDFAFKTMLGKGIEDLILASIKDTAEQLHVDTIEEKQNGQDIVIRLGDEIVYRIEVKSRWNDKYSFTLSQRQLSEAVDHPHRYALCGVDLVGYATGDKKEDPRHLITDINLILDKIWFVPNIGDQIATLVKPIKAVEHNEDELRLTEEYRLLVPQRVVKAGKRLPDFIDYLTIVLSS